MRSVRDGVRRVVAQLIRHVLPAAVAALLAVPAGAGAAPSPSPAPTPVLKRVDLTKVQPKALLPKKPLHAEYVVEVNRLGQVARVRDGKNSPDHAFNFHTYGNALQSFIRTPDGNVVVGTYLLSYDYDPKTAHVKRDVRLLRRGGVNPNAIGAVNDLEAIARKHHDTPPPHAGSPVPRESVDPRALPELNGVMRPTAAPK